MRRIGFWIGGASAVAAGIVVVNSILNEGASYAPEDRFSGGSLQGYAMAFLLQAPSTVILPSRRFSGASLDGHAAGAILVNELNPVVYPPRYSGGHGDGHDDDRMVVNVEGPVVFALRFSGGGLDGYADGYWLVSGTGGKAFIRYSGGPGDGYDFAVLLASGGGPHPSLSRFYGGPKDGYAFAGMYPGGFTAAPLSPRFFGGGWDGYSVHGIRVPMSEVALDSDGDGLPDWWETLYFGGPTLAVAHAISDASGMSNLEKHIANLTPGDPDAVLAFVGPQSERTESGGTMFVLTWPTARGRKYRVYMQHNLLDGWPDNHVAELYGNGQMATYVHVSMVEGPHLFQVRAMFMEE